MKTVTSLQRLVGAFLLIVSLSTAKVSGQQQADVIAEASQAYGAGHFIDAIELYGSAADAGATSAALFYNLGNAEYRTGALGHAILNYERALALQPQHPEARANLHLARDKAHALELQAAWWDAITGRATPDQFAIGAAVCAWLGAFCFAACFFARRRSTALVLASFLAFAAGILAAVALYALETGRNGRALAIVTGKDIQARVATADNAGSVLALPPGSEIKILSTRGAWIYAALPNDLRGWIPASSAERVRL